MLRRFFSIYFIFSENILSTFRISHRRDMIIIIFDPPKNHFEVFTILSIFLSIVLSLIELYD